MVWLYRLTRTLRRARTTVLATLAALTLCLGLAACSGGPGSADAAEGDVLRFGLSGEPQEIKVGADSGATGYLLDSLVHRGLLTLDQHGNITAGLAEEWKELDPATYEFTLREGLTFSDGSPITSENVKKSLTFLADPANGARVLQAMQQINKIETPDERTVVVHLKENNSSFLGFLADPTAFIAPDAALKSGAVAEETFSGPFMIEEKNSGVSMTLTRNPDYYAADAVQLDQIELIYYADGTARTNALISGDVDIIDYVPWESFERLRNDSNLKVDAQPGLLMDVEFNVESGPFTDPKVRQAVAYAVNRDNVVKGPFFGNAKAVYAPPVPEESPYYEALPKELWNYDPQKAKQLLAEAGYPDGFSTTLLTTSQYIFHEDTALTVQADLKAIGIDAKLDSPDWSTRMAKATDGDYEIKINGWGGVVSDPSYIESYLGGPDLAKSYGWDNPEVMKLFAEARTAADEETRTARYVKAYHALAADVPFVPLVQREQAFAYRTSVHGFHNLPGFATFYSGYSLATTSIDNS